MGGSSRSSRREGAPGAWVVLAASLTACVGLPPLAPQEESTGDPQADTGGTGTTGGAVGDSAGSTSGVSTGSGSDDDSQDTDVLGGVCGDGVVEGDEECDLGAENGQGDACRTDCMINVCGDGYLGPGEACDDGNQNNDDQCTTECGLASCGDGSIQAGEECDDGAANSLDGACLPSCVMAFCGDQNIQAGVETCDSNNTGGATCQSQGFDGGVLECSADCMSFDTSNCHACGNGVIEVNEICDNNAFPPGTTCQTYAPGGTTVSGGALECVNNCTAIDSSGCTFCGDDNAEGPEACDGTDLGGETCSSLLGAQFRGPLVCNAICQLDTSNCCLSDGEVCTSNGQCCSNNCVNAPGPDDICEP